MTAPIHLTAHAARTPTAPAARRCTCRSLPSLPQLAQESAALRPRRAPAIVPRRQSSQVILGFRRIFDSMGQEILSWVSTGGATVYTVARRFFETSTRPELESHLLPCRRPDALRICRANSSPQRNRPDPEEFAHQRPFAGNAYAFGPGSSVLTLPSASVAAPRVCVSCHRPVPSKRIAKICPPLGLVPRGRCPPPLAAASHAIRRAQGPSGHHSLRRRPRTHRG
jgi:hypothetical protein